MTQEDLRNLVITNTGRTDKSDYIDQSLSFGLKTLCQSFMFDELRQEWDSPVVAGDIFVNLPSLLDQLVEVRLIAPASPALAYPLELLRKRIFVNRFPNVIGSTITGRPYWCYRDKTQLFLDRKCDSSYTIRMTGYFLDTFNVTTDEPQVVGCEEYLVAYATCSTYKSVQMYQDAQFWEAEWKKLRLNLLNSRQRELGVHNVAREWKRDIPIMTNAPWLDPFSGHRDQP